MSDLRFHVSADRFHSFPARFPALRGKEAASFPYHFRAVSYRPRSFPVSCLYTGNGKRSPTAMDETSATAA
jgi:hypothetical protein